MLDITKIMIELRDKRPNVFNELIKLNNIKIIKN